MPVREKGTFLTCATGRRRSPSRCRATFPGTSGRPHDPRRVPPRRSRARRLDRRLSRARAARRISGDVAHAPGQLRDALPRQPPQEPEPSPRSAAISMTLILPACTHWQDPRFHGYFPSNGLPAAVLGDLVSTGLGQLGLNWQSSPALTELEEVCLDWWRQMLGLSERWSGVIQDTASTATFVALVCARERATNHAATRGGLQGQQRPLMIYVSAQAHSSVEKAALLAGFGRENLRIDSGRRAISTCAPTRSPRRSPRIAPPAASPAPSSPPAAPPRPRPSTPRRDRADRARRGAVAARRCRDGGLGHDPARVPRPVGWRRSRRFAGREPAQVVRRVDGLLDLLRARPAVPGARHVHQPELPADRGRRPGEELPRLGRAARAAACARSSCGS